MYVPDWVEFGVQLKVPVLFPLSVKVAPEGTLVAVSVT